MSQEGYSHGFSSPDPGAEQAPGLRAADALVNILVAAGVEIIFGLPGGAIAPLYDALLDRPEIRLITARHESGAMFAAQAYARATGKIGVVLVTSGPGILNAFTGLAAAHCDGMPLLLLAGEVPRKVFGRQALQEGSSYHLDIVAACAPFTKLAASVPFADSAPGMLHHAITTALSGRRGPVVLTLPLDVMTTKIREPSVVGDISVARRVTSASMRRALDVAARSLSSAKRPVIFAGSGTRWGDGPTRLRELAEHLQAPVMTTPKAKGVFPETHPLSLGVFGYGGHPSATAYLTEGVDVVLTVGSGLSDVSTDGWSKLLIPTASFIQIDIDAMQIGRNYPVTQGLIGHADELLRQLDVRLPEAHSIRTFGVKRYTDPAIEKHGPEGRITPMRALWELQRAMPRNTMFTCDIGEHLLYAIQYLVADDPEAFQVMTGLGSMGSSIAAAVGARLGSPDRPAVAVCGDGCFWMAYGDLAIAVRDRIPIVVAVLNDQRYGMVELGHTAIFGRTPPFSTGDASIASVAESIGATAVRITAGDQIPDLDVAAILAGSPLVLDIQIDRQVRMPRNARFDDIKTSTRSSSNSLN